MDALSNSLSITERGQLAICEAQVASSLDTISREWQRAAVALATIRDNRLYRESADTFQAYVEDRWHLSRSTAYEWIDAASTVRVFGHASVEPPRRVAVAFELAKLPEGDRVPVLQGLREANGGREPSAIVVAKVVESRIQLSASSPHGHADVVPPEEYLHRVRQGQLADTIRKCWSQLDPGLRARLLEELQKLYG